MGFVSCPRIHHGPLQSQHLHGRLMGVALSVTILSLTNELEIRYRLPIGDRISWVC